jgi:hypothetical protein
VSSFNKLFCWILNYVNVKLLKFYLLYTYNWFDTYNYHFLHYYIFGSCWPLLYLPWSSLYAGGLVVLGGALVQCLLPNRPTDYSLRGSQSTADRPHPYYPARQGWHEQKSPMLFFTATTRSMQKFANDCWSKPSSSARSTTMSLTVICMELQVGDRVYGSTCSIGRRRPWIHGPKPSWIHGPKPSWGGCWSATRVTPCRAGDPTSSTLWPAPVHSSDGRLNNVVGHGHMACSYSVAGAASWWSNLGDPQRLSPPLSQLKDELFSQAQRDVMTRVHYERRRPMG